MVVSTILSGDVIIFFFFSLLLFLSRSEQDKINDLFIARTKKTSKCPMSSDVRTRLEEQRSKKKKEIPKDESTNVSCRLCSLFFSLILLVSPVDNNNNNNNNNNKTKIDDNSSFRVKSNFPSFQRFSFFSFFLSLPFLSRQLQSITSL